MGLMGGFVRSLKDEAPLRDGTETGASLRTQSIVAEVQPWVYLGVEHEQC